MENRCDETPMTREGELGMMKFVVKFEKGAKFLREAWHQRGCAKRGLAASPDWCCVFYVCVFVLLVIFCSALFSHTVLISDPR